MESIHFLLFFVLICLSSSIELPSYIKACSRNDPKLNECVVKSGRAAIPHFIHGDSNYMLPNMDPLAIKEMKIQKGNSLINFNLSLTDYNLFGLSNADFSKARVDLKRRHVEWDFINKKGLEIIGPYAAAGHVLIINMAGQGPAYIKLEDLTVSYEYDYKFYKKDDGKEYMNITKAGMTFTVGRAFFNFENLFNGSKVLGDNVNRLLNYNWKIITDQFAPEVGGSISEEFRRVLNSVYSLVPYDKIFPDT